MWFVSAWQNQLHDREAASGRDRLANIGENANGSCVVPIVQDEFEEVKIAAGRHFLREVAADQSDAIAEPRDEFAFRSISDHRRKIEQDALGRRIAFQDGSKERAVPAADIDNAGEPAELVVPEHRCIGNGREVGHCLAEQGLEFGMLGVVRPDRHLEDALEGGARLCEAGFGDAPGIVVVVSKLDLRKRPHAARTPERRTSDSGVGV